MSGVGCRQYADRLRSRIRLRLVCQGFRIILQSRQHRLPLGLYFWNRLVRRNRRGTSQDIGLEKLRFRTNLTSTRAGPEP